MKSKTLIAGILGVFVLVGVWAGLRAGPVRYEYVLPNDFVGDITVIYHPNGPDSVSRNYFGKTTFRMEVPESGIVVTSDFDRLCYMADDEVWCYRDGRVIKKWPNVLSPGFSFVGSSAGVSVRGIDKHDPPFTGLSGIADRRIGSSNLHRMLFENEEGAEQGGGGNSASLRASP
jgi:hypothetical protein